jgi:hypothetical protein
MSAHHGSVVGEHPNVDSPYGIGFSSGQLRKEKNEIAIQMIEREA